MQGLPYGANSPSFPQRDLPIAPGTTQTCNRLISDPLALRDYARPSVHELKALPQRLKRATALVAEGKAFFTPENFALFPPLLDQDCRAGASNALKHYEGNFDLCRWAVSPKLGSKRSGRAA
jgi:hypothetical protein